MSILEGTDLEVVGERFIDDIGPLLFESDGLDLPADPGFLDKVVEYVADRIQRDYLAFSERIRSDDSPGRLDWKPPVPVTMTCEGPS